MCTFQPDLFLSTKLVNIKLKKKDFLLKSQYIIWLCKRALNKLAMNEPAGDSKSQIVANVLRYLFKAF